LPWRHGRVVRRLPHRFRRVREDIGEVELLVDVIAERDCIDARRPDVAVVARRQAGPVRDVLGVGDDKVEPLRGAQHRHRPAEHVQPRSADHVTDEEETHDE
jgi:hypothetical protein